MSYVFTYAANENHIFDLKLLSISKFSGSSK